MTYCVGMLLDRGLVFMSDTRTNSGVDNIATYRKMFTWEKPGDRAVTMLTVGNLATTQAVVSLIDERAKHPAERRPSILEAPTMFQAARLVGDLLREVIRTTVKGDGQEAETPFQASIILGGQIKDMPPRLFLIYPEGNFIEASEETPFFQAGETKYGRPILVRAYNPAMTFEQAVKLLLVSFDSTLKANLSVGAPLDLSVIGKGDLAISRRRRFEADDPYFAAVSRGWGEALKSAFDKLPDFSFDR